MEAVCPSRDAGIPNTTPPHPLHSDFLIYLQSESHPCPSCRAKYHSGRERPNGLNKSRDSTSLPVLLERARTAFHTPSAGNSPHNSSHFTSDHDSGVNTCQPGDVSSCEGATPPLVSPRIQSYINGLGEGTDHGEQKALTGLKTLSAVVILSS